MKNLKVKDFMTSDPEIITPMTSLKEAAWKMKNNDCGFLPVCLKNEVKGIKHEIIGVITDRDIVIRAISQGFDPEKSRVEEFMTDEVYGCNENDFLEDAIDKMHEHGVSRLVVRSKSGDITGVISFGGILRKRANTSEVSTIIKRTALKFY